MNFENAYNKLIGYEGGYSNDPDDKGGETFCGIARNYHSDWPGWAIIDGKKTFENFELLLNTPEMQKLVRDFYKKEFWDAFKADDIPYLIAEEIFEQAVNIGIPNAAKHVQLTCNILNRGERLYSNILADGKYGTISKVTLDICIQKNGIDLVYNVLNIFQGSYYLSLMLKNETYEKYIGWFNRIELRKKV